MIKGLNSPQTWIIEGPVQIVLHLNVGTAAFESRQQLLNSWEFSPQLVWTGAEFCRIWEEEEGEEEGEGKGGGAQVKWRKRVLWNIVNCILCSCYFNKSRFVGNTRRIKMCGSGVWEWICMGHVSKEAQTIMCDISSGSGPQACAPVRRLRTSNMVKTWACDLASTNFPLPVWEM